MATIVLLAGTVKAADRVGHHDYLGGCTLAASLLEQTSGVRAVVVHDGWPEDDAVFAEVCALVVYAGGDGKHPLLQSAERIARVQRLVDRGVGLVAIHQAVRCPRALAAPVTAWLGGAHLAGESGRGHWRTHHRIFPAHPATRGVRPWTIKDGWLNRIQFVERQRGITPLVWSSREHRGSSEGGPAAVASWAYERPDGGRSFCFTGLDAHTAWLVPGVRQLLVNGMLWSAGLPVPAGGAPCAADATTVERHLTPRRASGPLRRLVDVIRHARR